MTPLKLTLKGFVSYREEQTIDFTRLSQDGIFGIFGRIGSGKSTITDGILFCLYGDIGKDGPKKEDFINTQCKEAIVEFEFKINNISVYRVSRKVSRTKPTVWNCYQQNASGNWDVVELKKNENPGEKLLNIQENYFKRTTIIPQGKFREFIELTGVDRNKMLRDLFDLNRFDLQSRLKPIGDELNGRKAIIEFQLAEIPTDLKDQVESMKKEVQDLNKLIKELQSKKYVLEEQKKVLEAAKDHELRLQEIIKHIGDQESKKKKVDEAFALADVHKKLNEAFALPVKEYDSINKELSECVKKLTTAEGQLNDAKNSLLAANEEVEKAKAALEITTSNEERVPLLTNLVNKKKAESRLINARPAIDAQEKIVKQTKTELDKIDENQKEYNALITDLDQLRIQEHLLQSWLVIQEKESELLDYQRSEKTSQNALSKFCEELNTTPEECIGWIDLEKNKLIEEAAERNERLAHARVQEKLGQLVTSLSEGEACPICGSTEHPQPLMVEDVQAELAQLKNEQTKSDDTLHKLEIIRREYFLLTQSINQKKKHVERVQGELDKLNEKLDRDLKSSNWLRADIEKLDLNDLQEQRADKANVKEELDKAINAKSDKQKLHIEASNRLDLYKKEVAAIEGELSIYTGNLAS